MLIEQHFDQDVIGRVALSAHRAVKDHLDVDGKGYLYFNTHSLVEGFLMHVGMKRMTAMTQEQTSAMLEALQDGSAVKMLQAEVTELKARIIELKNMIRTQRNTIKELKN